MMYRHRTRHTTEWNLQQKTIEETVRLLAQKLDEPIASPLAQSDAEVTPETAAAAWDAEVARRIEEINCGEVVWIPNAQVVAVIDALLRNTQPRFGDRADNQTPDFWRPRSSD